MNNNVDLRQKNNIDKHNPKNPNVSECSEEKVGEENYLTEKDIEQYVNPQRRQFLKFILIGIGGFFLGRLFGPIIKFLKPPDSQEVLIKPPEPEKKMELQNWKVVEGENQITFIDKKTNEEVLILD